MDWDWRLGLGNVIEDWKLGLRLGIANWRLDRVLGLGIKIGIGEWDCLFETFDFW